MTTDATGSFALDLPAGDYTLTPQPVEGLLGTASPVVFSLRPNAAPEPLDISYDTGIR